MVRGGGQDEEGLRSWLKIEMGQEEGQEGGQEEVGNLEGRSW